MNKRFAFLLEKNEENYFKCYFHFRRGKMRSEMIDGKMRIEMIEGRMRSEMIEGKMRSEMIEENINDVLEILRNEVNHETKMNIRTEIAIVTETMAIDSVPKNMINEVNLGIKTIAQVRIDIAIEAMSNARTDTMIAIGTIGKDEFYRLLFEF